MSTMISLVPHDDVPNELWMDIFETIDVPQDLHAVVLTCKKFYDCGIRALLRNLVWSTPADVATNLPVWFHNHARGLPNDLDVLAADVRSLSLGVSSVPETFPVTFVDEHGHIKFGPLMPEATQGAAQFNMMRSLRYYQVVGRRTFATASLYGRMCQRMLSFTNLERLECRDLVFTDDLFGVIYTLPCLHKLHIELCMFPMGNALQHRDHTVLPITELKLLNLRRRVSQMHEFAPGGNDMEDDLIHVLNLSLAPNLRSLHIDSTADVLGRVFTVWDISVPGYVYHVPQCLERLYISKKAYHRGQAQPQFAGEQFFPDRALYALFSRCPTIQTISLECQLPRHTAFPDDCLPNLHNVEGLAEAVMAMGVRKPLQAISLLWSDNVLYGTLDSLGLIAESHGSRLQMLAVECPKWDDEVLHAVCMLFPELRRLKLTYWAEGPPEDTIVSLGPLFLSRLRHLHTIQVFENPQGQHILQQHSQQQLQLPAIRHYFHLPSPPLPASTPTPILPASDSLYDASFGSIEDEMRDLVIPWNKYCPNLRDVQLSAGWKMTRAGLKGGWEAQRVRRTEREDFRF